MIWLKRIFLWLMGLVFLLLIGVSLLGFTHQGNKWLWQQAKGALPSLKGELVAGQLGYGWTLEGVGWQDELVEVTVDRAVLDWDLGKLLQGKLWIKSLVVTHPVVKVADSEPTPEEPSEPFVWHPLPLKIQVDSLKVADLDLALPGVAVTLGSLDIGASLNRKGLIVRGPVLDNLKVTLDDAANVTRVVGPDGAHASLTYGAFGELARLVDPLRLEPVEVVGEIDQRIGARVIEQLGQAGDIPATLGWAWGKKANIFLGPQADQRLPQGIAAAQQHQAHAHGGAGYSSHERNRLITARVAVFCGFYPGSSPANCVTP